MINVLKSGLAAVVATGTLVAVGLFAPVMSAAAGPAPACGNHSLAATHTPLNGAAGHDSFVLLYRNVSAATCTIHGYPGLDALSATGHVLAHAQRTLHGFAGGASSVTTVTLAPGGFASAVVEWADISAQSGHACVFSKSVATTPANTTATLHFPLSVSTCSLQIHPTVAGTSRNTRFAEAQEEWMRGAHTALATMGFFWTRAEADLKLDGATYSAEINLLRQLMTLPDADQTPAQNAAFHHDITALDNFFGTTTLYR